MLTHKPLQCRNTGNRIPAVLLAIPSNIFIFVSSLLEIHGVWSGKTFIFLLFWLFILFGFIFAAVLLLFLLITATAGEVILSWTYLFPVDTSPSSVRLSVVQQMFPRSKCFHVFGRRNFNSYVEAEGNLSKANSLHIIIVNVVL